MDAKPKYIVLTAESTREEVLAAVAEHDQRAEQSRRAFEDADFGPLPPEGERRGCYTSLDGSIRVNYGDGLRDEDPVLSAQQLAGEEDQSQPGWDQSV